MHFKVISYFIHRSEAPWKMLLETLEFSLLTSILWELLWSYNTDNHLNCSHAIGAFEFLNLEERSWGWQWSFKNHASQKFRPISHLRPEMQVNEIQYVIFILLHI